MNYSHIKVGLSLNNNQGDPDLNLSTSSVDDNQACTAPVDPDFAYSDGNIELQISGRRFWVHEFLLTRFTRFTKLIRQARDRGELSAGPEHRTIIRIQSNREVQCIDFQNTFRVIYSSMSFVFNPVPPSFDVETLVSTLRVATLFENLDLRNFAISQLEAQKSYTTAIDRIALSDELKLPDWEVPAFAELCRRPEPISPEEATILGITRFAEIARIREAEQRQRYVEWIDQVATDPFLAADGTVMKDRLQTTAEQTLKHSSIPKCDCRVQKPSSPVKPSILSSPAPAPAPGLAPPPPPPPPPGPPGPAPPASPASPAPPAPASGLRLGAPQASFGRFEGLRGFRVPPPGTIPEPSLIVTCQIHQLAPSIASESRTLYKHLSSTLERIEALKRAVSASTQRPPGGDKRYSIEDELKEASWVRKAA